MKTKGNGVFKLLDAGPSESFRIPLWWNSPERSQHRLATYVGIIIFGRYGPHRTFATAQPGT